MTHDVSAALAAVGVLGMFFPQTRVFSLAAVAVLTLRFPSAGLVILLGCVVAFFYLRK